MQKTIDTRKLVRIITIVALLVVLPLALLLIRQRQEIRKKAGATPHISFPAGPYSVNDVITVTIGNFPAGLLFAEVTNFSFDSTKWQVVQAPYDIISGPTTFVSPSPANNYKLRVGAGSYSAPFSGAVLYKIKLKPLVTATADDPLRLTLVYNLVDATAIETAGSEEATVVVSQPASTPTTAPATPTVPGAPVNGISAPAIAAVGTGTDPYSVQVSLSASPAPTLFGGAVNAIKILGTPTSAQPPASAWSGACSSALPTGGAAYCSTTMQTSLNYVFNGSTPGTKYLWAIFHNDVGNTAASYWGTTNGWSSPVSTGAITLSAPATPTVPGAPINSVSAPATATVGTGTDPYSVLLSLSASPAPSLFAGAVNAIKILGTPTSAQPPASAWAIACSGTTPTGSAAYCSTTMQSSLNYVFNGSTPGTKYLWAIFHNDVGNTAAAYWGASNGWSIPISTGAITLPGPSATPTPCVDATAPSIPPITIASCDAGNCYFSWGTSTDQGGSCTAIGGVEYLYKAFDSSMPGASASPCGSSQGGGCWRTDTAVTLPMATVANVSNFTTACPGNVCTLRIWAKDANGNISGTQTRTFTVPSSCTSLDTTRPPTPGGLRAGCDTTNCSFSWDSVNDAGCADNVKYLYKIFSTAAPTGTEIDCTAPGGSCWRLGASDSLGRSIITGSSSYATACPGDTCTLSLWVKDANGNISSVATKPFSTLPIPTRTPVP